MPSVARHPSHRSGRRSPPLCPAEARKRRGTPRLRSGRHKKGARGDIKGNHSEHPISSFRTSYSCRFERSEKSPHPVMPLPPVLPNDSEASLILAREEEGSRLRPRGDKKRGLGATKRGSKRQREGLHKNIFEQPFPTLDYFIPNV
jgi:hypothetical protein